MIIDIDNTDNAVVFGRQGTNIDSEKTILNWPFFARKELYLDLDEDSIEDMNLLSTIIGNGWSDIDDTFSSRLSIPFYFELANNSTTATVGFKEEVSSSESTVEITTSNFTTWTSPVFEYSYDNSTWNNYTLGNSITLNSSNSRVYFRGDNLTSWYVFESMTINEVTTGGSIYVNAFINTSSVKAGGNIMSLRYIDFNNIFTLPCPNTFYNLFENCDLLVTSPLLPAINITHQCYVRMFYGCTSLEKAPLLPATTLDTYCYAWMFQNCTSLKEAPALPATTLMDSCYHSMFQNCTSLKETPALSATTLADYCYAYMFYNCTSLTTTFSILPATTLQVGCYDGMFKGCISLTNTPILPATTLANYCYAEMFASCISLTTPPALPATTAANNCYGSWVATTAGMFYRCCNLTSIPKLPITDFGSTDSCYCGMFVNSVKANATSSAPCIYEYRIPTTGTATGTYLTTEPDKLGTTVLKDMFDNIDGTGTFTPTPNTTFYISVPSF